MELRDFAASVLTSPRLEDKLRRPRGRLTDEDAGDAVRLDGPERGPGIRIVPGRQAKVPPPEGMSDPDQRLRILHALANHELQAVELFAWAILAFPGAPAAFRQGCLAVLKDEQVHCRLYLRRLGTHHVRFGDYPVSGHFWGKTRRIRTPLQFVCTMGLTFENANLDFSKEYCEAARDAGDDRTAAVLQRVHQDEIAHVRFAWRWLVRLKDPATSAWDAYSANVVAPLGPARARGASFDRVSRIAAGLDPGFVDVLERTVPEKPGGARR